MPKTQSQVTEEFINGVKGFLTSKKGGEQKSNSVADAINKAVVERNIVQIAGVKGNKGSLTDIEKIDGFDENGMIKPDATFSYSHPERTKTEMEQFSRDNMSDREKLIMTSIYFNVGSDIIEHGVRESPAMVDKAREFVANELREVAGMKTPTSYDPSPAMLKKLDDLLIIVALQPLMQEAADLVNYYDGLEKKTAAHKVKSTIFQSTIEAVNQFNKNGNRQELQNEMSTISDMLANVDRGMKISQGDARKLMDKIVEKIKTNIVTLERNPSRSLLHQELVSKGGKFGKAAQTAPSSPRGAKGDQQSHTQPNSPRHKK